MAASSGALARTGDVDKAGGCRPLVHAAQWYSLITPPKSSKRR